MSEQQNNKNLIEAKLQNVRKKMGKLSKNVDGFKYKYADLNQLLDIVNPIFEKEDLLLKQPIITNGNVNILSTEISLIGNSEACITSQMALPTMNDMQAIGSSITYARRYTLKSLLGMQDEDDDGDATLGKPKFGKSKQKTSSDSLF